MKPSVLASHIAWLLFTASFSTSSALAEPHTPQGVQTEDIDREVDSCTDFFEFANGRWRADNPIPPSMSRWGRRRAAAEDVKEQLRELLETAASTRAPNGSIDQLTGDFYAGCMNEAEVNRLGAKPVEPLLAAIERMRGQNDVQSMIARLHAIAIASPFKLYPYADAHDPTFVIAQFVAAGLGMPDRDYYTKPEPRFEEARKRYRRYVSRLFALTGSSTTQAQAAADVVMRMETQLARASLDNVARRDPRATDHKMSFAELHELTPAFDWKAYYGASNLQPGEVNVAEPKFMQELDRQLRQTPLADWKIYLKWHVLDSAAPSLASDFVQAEFDFRGAFLGGARQLKPRWKRCVEATDTLLGDALGQKYVEKYFPPAAKARVQELVANVRLAMRETIEDLDWMSAQTKQQALLKLSTLNPKIGYPDRWKNYSGVQVQRDAFWESSLAGRRFLVADNLATVDKPVDRGRWLMTPPTSNAYYNPRLNEIVFPAGILRPPAFDMAASNAVNYGAAGVIIGHEISHGFDDQGARFDAQGRLKNWWTAPDLERFQARSSCIVRQFEGYYVEPGLHHNGKLVLGESIGDLAGVKIAYRAFEISQRGSAPPPTIDGFTPAQQFFISWGQFRGDAERPEFVRTMVQGDPHPSAKYRVIGPMSNLPQFHAAFSCPKDAPMVRPAHERCELW